MQKPLGCDESKNLSSVERKGVFKIKSEDATLVGNVIKIGDEAPDFIATDNNFKDVKLSDFHNKIVVISVFPSIDTPVCATQTRTFNKRATSLSDEVVVVGVSKDLPFALGRFCGAEGIDKVYTLSDFKYSRFGMEYGLLVKENQLLARAVIVVDRDRSVKYFEITQDILDEPNYDAALKAVESLL
ncbi:MAG: thiol peroxidase [Bacteroidales bacterium]